MLKLFYSPGACSLASHIILEEIAQPYEAIKVDLATHRVNGEDYYKINPQGSVPAIQLEDGTVITQNSAILLYLADTFVTHQLVPAVNTLARVRCHEWLSFLTADVHKAFTPLFKPDALVSSEQAITELKEKVTQNIKKYMTLVDKKLTSQFALGENYSIVDAYLVVLYLWANHLKLFSKDWARYEALAQRVLNRPATKRAMMQEGLIK